MVGGGGTNVLQFGVGSALSLAGRRLSSPRLAVRGFLDLRYSQQSRQRIHSVIGKRSSVLLLYVLWPIIEERTCRACFPDEFWAGVEKNAVIGVCENLPSVREPEPPAVPAYETGKESGTEELLRASQPGAS